MPETGFELSSTLELARAPSEVFGFLADTASFKVVDRALVDVEPTGRLGPGVQGRMTHRRGGMQARTSWAVVGFDEGRHLAVAIRGLGYAMTESATIHATSDGCVVTFVDRVWPTSAPGRILVALSGGVMRRDLAKRAELLKAALERAP